MSAASARAKQKEQARNGHSVPTGGPTGPLNARRTEERLLPNSVEVWLVLDRSARRERDASRRGGPARANDYAR